VFSQCQNQKVKASTLNVERNITRPEAKQKLRYAVWQPGRIGSEVDFDFFCIGNSFSINYI